MGVFEEDESSPTLGRALGEILMHPRRTLFAAWSWKAAAMSMVLRAVIFLVANLRAGSHKAVRAMLVEAAFAIFAAGLLGAVSQLLRDARPVWATGLFVWIGMPTAMLLAQFGVHHLAGTPHVKTGLIASFCFASIASSFSWYAMRQGVLLGGAVGTSLLHDVRALPRVVLGYVTAPVRALRAGKSSGL